jgi:hypothetical protein
MDFTQLINNKQISEGSKKVYLALLKRVVKTGFKIPIKKNEKIPELTEFLQTFDNPNTRLEMLNLMIVLRTESNVPTDEMKKLRTVLNKEKKSAQPAKMKAVGETLMGYEDFKVKLDRAFEDKNYKQFIVNYLMSSYAVRNKDLDLTIIRDKKDIVAGNNYLLIGTNNITYIRDDYKTHKTYGKQEHVITDPKFQSAVEIVGNSKLIPESQLVNGLRKLYIDKMGEGQIFKMMIDYYTKTKNSAEIKRIAASRGTSLDTVKEHYDVNSAPTAIELAALLPEEPDSPMIVPELPASVRRAGMASIRAAERAWFDAKKAAEAKAKADAAVVDVAAPKKKFKIIRKKRQSVASTSEPAPEVPEVPEEPVKPSYETLHEKACDKLSNSEGKGFKKIAFKYKNRKNLYRRNVDDGVFQSIPPSPDMGLIGYLHGINLKGEFGPYYGDLILKPGVSYDIAKKMYVGPIEY